MHVSTSANVVIARPIVEVFDAATDMTQFHKFFTGWGPIAGNERVELLDGDRLRAGTRRRVFNRDGTILLEEVRHYSRPRKHTYRIIAGLPWPLAALVKHGDANWVFRDLAESTSVTWQYKFRLRNPALFPAAASMVKLPMRAAMQRCLDNLRQTLEAPAAEPPAEPPAAAA